MDESPALLAQGHLEELRLDPGRPPIAVSHGQPHFLDAPLVNTSNTSELLRSLTNDEEKREFNLRGIVDFTHTAPNQAPIHVRAIRHGQSLSLELQSLGSPRK